MVYRYLRFQEVLHGAFEVVNFSHNNLIHYVDGTDVRTVKELAQCDLSNMLQDVRLVGVSGGVL